MNSSLFEPLKARRLDQPHSLYTSPPWGGGFRIFVWPDTHFSSTNVHGAERLRDEPKYNVREGGMNSVVFSIIHRGLEIPPCRTKPNKEGLNL